MSMSSVIGSQCVQIASFLLYRFILGGFLAHCNPVCTLLYRDENSRRMQFF